MAKKDAGLRFLRNLKSGVPLYLRMEDEGGAWRRPGIFDESYFSEGVGKRIDDEFQNHSAQVEGKYGSSIGMAIIEVTYQDKDGKHLTRRHVAEKPDEQKESDKK
ncbi:uncharacterized protein ARB_01913 [Trichophyton benhamiae CBS 112371]|uniref:Uncharacterized protein n=1 Tax=Arthroderma benhamiae (strain ATCC MYA-4681 / CBS 112371) TaxID=663331 RepID=D4B0D9_ARTBC|nr:uncharacterized protein ARB_01913 [Trichophyton benhamiae CBS 112371]EFE31291.1 hypothetical protein ARB_01913 [Trichophyton benhamiae CBS 112371]